MNIPSLQHAVSPEEWQLRCDLAACYRLVALYGWSDLVFTHISAKLPESSAGPGAHHFLIKSASSACSVFLISYDFNSN